jgi:N6-adenosine-specific RNA methylase IME4
MTTISSGPFAGLQQNCYGLIEADPAWSWVNFSGKGSAPHRTADAPYEVLSLDELRALPVGDLAAKDCLLNMWVIGSHLDQAIALGRAWGFTFKSDGFVWVKTGKHDPAVRPISMGKWVRKQVEYSLLFSRGKPRRLDADVRQLLETGDNVIYASKREHSRKPEERYARLERLAGGPYVELFARQQREGWDSFGDQTDRFNLPPCSANDDFADLLGDSFTIGESIVDFSSQASHAHALHQHSDVFAELLG